MHGDNGLLLMHFEFVHGPRFLLRNPASRSPKVAGFDPLTHGWF
jgi:hypothetical protein